MTPVLEGRDADVGNSAVWSVASEMGVQTGQKKRRCMFFNKLRLPLVKGLDQTAAFG